MAGAGRITMRLDRFLAEMGCGTRSQIRDAAKNGRIRVNGAVEKSPDRKIDPETDAVSLDDRAVAYARYEYYMLNKPAGVVSATEDRVHTTAVDLIGGRLRDDLFPVGRLDIDTEGLLLITNDGDLAHRLLSPKKHVDKRYLAVVSGELPADAGERFAAGITLEDGTVTLPAVLESAEDAVIPKGAGSAADPESAAGAVIPERTEGTARAPQTAERGDRQAYILTIREGKYHQVKRMFEALGCTVVYLKRLSMGSLRLDGKLRPGEYRPLTDEELAALKEGR